jgi:hypothetical protein
MDNTLKALGKTDTEFRVGNYIVLFGGRDLVGEYFTPQTALESSYTKSGVLHIDFEHGFDHDDDGMDQNEIMGYVDWKTARVDDKGVFVERVLKRQARYMEYIEPLIEEGLVGTSSQAIAGKTKKTKDGEIKDWPLMRDSLTFTPMEPRMLTENAMRAVKSLYAQLPQCESLRKAAIANIVDIDAVKSKLDAVDTIADLENFLREAGGFSKALAKAVLARSKVVLGREAQPALDEKALAELNRLLNLPPINGELS